jgi:hypothetical protein
MYFDKLWLKIYDRIINYFIADCGFEIAEKRPEEAS